MTTLANRDGYALVTVLLVTLVVAALAAAASMMVTNNWLVTSYFARQSELSRVADAGVELGRARLNADPSLYPDSGFITLENDVPVVDAAGAAIPNVRRWTYAAPIGITSGEYGIFGAVVTVARDGGGGVAVRRLNTPQESFAKYAYFTDFEPSNIAFGGGDRLFGPVHSNDDIRIYSSGATFFGHVTTGGTIDGRQWGDFRDGYRENAPAIPLPELADVVKLQAQATAGGTSFTGNTSAPWGQATTRIEFIPIELNGQDEGFIRVYRSSDAGWVVGAAPVADLRNSATCGHTHANGTFVSAADHPDSGPDSWVASVTNSTRACHLGGAPELFGGFLANDGRGYWLPWGGPVSPLLASRADRDYLFPITRTLNPDFKGVIFVDGDVAVSGVLRGRVTVAATGNIVIADDITYNTDPAAATCEDILGLFAGGDVIVANTPVVAPWQRGTGQAYFSYGRTRDEFIHAFVLTLNEFTVAGYDSGSRRDEPCEGSFAGRGCLRLTGGIIQRQRGPVGAIWAWGPPGVTGYLKRYSYDSCGVTAPPPYFPTTGRFARGTYYEVDPSGFQPGPYFQLLTAGQ